MVHLGVHVLHSMGSPLQWSEYCVYSSYNKQLLDEVEHDIMNYQNRGLRYLPKSRLRQIAQTRGFENSWYHAKTEFIHFSHNSSSETEAKRSAILFLRRTLQGA